MAVRGLVDCALSHRCGSRTLFTVIDVPTLQGWLDKLGFDTAPENRGALRLRRRSPASGPRLPPFFIQCSEHWVLLSMLPLIAAGEWRPDDLGQRMLAANREMRVAKFATDKNNDLVLCAELPTESLDYSELADAVARMEQYARLFHDELMRKTK